MTPTYPAEGDGVTVRLACCPWCAQPPTPKRGKINPYAICTTEGCFGGRLPVINLDDQTMVEQYNRRGMIPGRTPPIVPPDDAAIAWARKLDRAATRHDQAATQAERDAASREIIALVLDDERMVQVARALLARVG